MFLQACILLQCTKEKFNNVAGFVRFMKKSMEIQTSSIIFVLLFLCEQIDQCFGLIW